MVSGVFILSLLVQLMSSSSLGTPRVTFILETPAKWKVFNVICVAGSPILCAAIAPTDSPATARTLSYSTLTLCITFSNSSKVMLCSCTKRCGDILHRISIFNISLSISSTSDRTMVFAFRTPIFLDGNEKSVFALFIIRSIGMGS